MISKAIQLRGIFALIFIYLFVTNLSSLNGFGYLTESRSDISLNPNFSIERICVGQMYCTNLLVFFKKKCNLDLRCGRTWVISSLSDGDLTKESDTILVL